jgi:hypothetical protein
MVATSRLSNEYGKIEPPFLVKEFNRWLSQDPLHYLPLYLTAAAIHAVRDNDQSFSLGGRALIVRLADRELDRLRAVSTKQNGFGEESLPRLAALAVARGGLDVVDVHRLAAADKVTHKKLALKRSPGSFFTILKLPNTSGILKDEDGSIDGRLERLRSVETNIEYEIAYIDESFAGTGITDMRYDRYDVLAVLPGDGYAYIVDHVLRDGEEFVCVIGIGRVNDRWVIPCKVDARGRIRLPCVAPDVSPRNRSNTFGKPISMVFHIPAHFTEKNPIGFRWSGLKGLENGL